jgi:hypothetical protein
LGDKISLIEAYKKQDSDPICTYNQRLYGWFDDDRTQWAMEILTAHDYVVTPVSSGDRLSWQRLVQYVRWYLDSRDLWQVKVVVDTALSARIAVRFGTKVKVVLSPRAVFSRQHIDATLAHEVDVHVMRYIHGKISGWNVLRKWTAGYLATEEWLAVFAAEQIHKTNTPDYINRAIYQKYILSAQGTMSFEHMYDFLRGWDYNRNKSLSQLFRTIVRQKKWVKNTADQSLLWWSKSKIYLDGYVLVRGLSDGERARLMCGKVALQYADLFKEL